jgi:spore coat polysaccharide biosynthesis protein SpsF
LQARTTSRRLPGKVLRDLCGAPMIIRQLERVLRARLVDRVVLATSVETSDDELAEIVESRGISVYRGSLDDVLGRFVGALHEYPAAHVVRLTGDCPLVDPDVVDAVVAQHLVCGANVTSNAAEPTFPDGLDVEVVSSAALERAGEEATLTIEREHVTQFFYRRRDQFDVVDYKGREDLSRMRWTVDRLNDLTFVHAVYQAIFPTKPDFGFRDVLRLLRDRPELEKINTGIARNEELSRAISEEMDWRNR